MNTNQLNINLSLETQIKNDIRQWAEYVGLPQKQLGGLSLCPFARAHLNSYDVTIVQNLNEIHVPTNDFELVIFVILAPVDVNALHDFCNQLGKENQNYVFLPDHKDKHTFINGVQTNNGKHNLVLCQPFEKLNLAREKLKKTLYYSYWDKDYLNEILGTDNEHLD